ncbi:hypothetical protein GOODEAATRI_033667 [Goodea atripinnis]|uniref:Antigen receptor n=1 Tax=Goodea atripinnis TaxID=208336 RepID=A0ABV0Q374_9TELE
MVKAGDEVTLTCGNVINGQESCDSNASDQIATLFENGEFHEDALTKADRLRVTSDCSVVMENVRGDDVGSYICRRLISGQQGPDSSISLSVITSEYLHHVCTLCS